MSETPSDSVWQRQNRTTARGRSEIRAAADKTIEDDALMRRGMFRAGATTTRSHLTKAVPAPMLPPRMNPKANRQPTQANAYHSAAGEFVPEAGSRVLGGLLPLLGLLVLISPGAAAV